MADVASIGSAMISERPIDSLKAAVLSLVEVLKLDFGEQWQRQFDTDPVQANEQLRQWKRRCYAKLRGVETKSIVDGYEQCVSERRPYMPNLSELTETVVRLDRQRKRDSAEVAQVSAPAFEGGIAGYVDQVLGPNADTPVAQRELAKMRAILARPSGTKAEREARLEANVKAHEALLRGQRELGVLHERGWDREHCRCAVTGCPKPGTMSNSITGGGVWYCREHYANRQRLGGSL